MVSTGRDRFQNVHTLRFSYYSNTLPSLKVTFEYSSISYEQIHWHTAHCIWLLSIKLKYIPLKRINTYKKTPEGTEDERKPSLDNVTSANIKDKKYKIIRNITWRTYLTSSRAEEVANPHCLEPNEIQG